MVNLPASDTDPNLEENLKGEVTSASINNKSSVASEADLEEAQAKPTHLSFLTQMKLLFSDPIYLLFVFGVLLGSNTIGGHNVAMAVMLETFGVPEVVMI